MVDNGENNEMGFPQCYVGRDLYVKQRFMLELSRMRRLQ